MCQFCVHHGDGKRWYANASNYALDLQADLRRRGYLVGFVHEFERHRRLITAGLNALRCVPTPVRGWLGRSISTAAQANHFGQPVPLEACASIFEIATNITRLPCVCRGAMRPGSNAESCCLIMTVNPHDALLAESFRDYAGGPQAEGFEKLTKAQALAYLRRAEERGLCHTAWTFITPFIAAICNCDLPSGCLAMKLQFTGGIRLMWKGEDVIRHHADRCTGCLRCEKQCPFGAISTEARRTRLRVDRAQCWGCGICRTVCSPAALTLEPRSGAVDVAEDW
jgi:Pyruvate/2-oxoacid:ferredoxin oxidoreductase delta subunit